MNIVRRLPPLVAFFNVIGYLDPRLLKIQWVDLDAIYTGQDSSYHAKYILAMDERSERIERIILRNGDTCNLMLSKIVKKKANKTRYYLTFERMVEHERIYSSLFIGCDLEQALLSFLLY